MSHLFLTHTRALGPIVEGMVGQRDQITKCVWDPSHRATLPNIWGEKPLEEKYIWNREMQVTDHSKILKLVILLIWDRHKDIKFADRDRRVCQVEKEQKYGG